MSGVGVLGLSIALGNGIGLSDGTHRSGRAGSACDDAERSAGNGTVFGFDGVIDEKREECYISV